MFNNCKRQAAESLTNAQHMQEPSSTSARRHGSRAGHLSKGNCVSKLPVIARRPPPQELAVAGKTQRRAPASPAQLSKELPPLCHKLKSVNKKKSTCKLAPSNFHTLRRRPIRRTRVAPSQEIHKEMSKTTPSLSLQALSPIPGGQDVIRGLDSRSVPLPLSSPDWTPVDWALMSSLHYRSPSPVDELDGETPDNSLSDQFCSLDLSPSQYEGEDEPLPTWVNPMSGGETRPPSPRTPVYLEPPVRLGAMFLRERDTASFRGEYSPVLPIAVAGPVFSPATLAERTQGGHLPVPTAGEHLDQLISDRRVSPTRALQDQTRTALSSAGPESSPDAVPADGSPATGTGLPSEERGELGGTSISSQRAFGLLEDLELELTELQVFQMEEIRILHGRMRERRGASPETKPPADPETLRRITESLLKEESDEEEGDLCRICLSWGGSPQNPLLSPCQCTGSLQYVHHDCLKRWIQGKVQSGAELTVVKTCELCKASLNLNLEGFNLECYRQRQAQVELRILRLLGRSLLDVPGVVVTNSNGAFTVMMLASRSRSDGTGHQAVVPSDETPDS